MLAENLKKLREFVAEVKDRQEARKVYDQLKDLAAQLERKHSFGIGKRRKSR